MAVTTTQQQRRQQKHHNSEEKDSQHVKSMREHNTSQDNNIHNVAWLSNQQVIVEQ